MQVITIRDRQSLLDIAMQSAGSVEAAISLGLKNNISITQTLTPGSTLLKIPVVNNEAALFYSVEGLSPATAETENIGAPMGGIGYMGIGIDFKVS